MAILIITLVISHFYQRRKLGKMQASIKVAQDALSEGDWPRAQAALEGCVAAHPSFAALRRMLGHSLASQGLHTRAEEEIRMAVALEPRVWDHQIYLATFLLQTERRAEAVAVAQQVFNTDPATREALAHNGAFLRLLRDDERTALFG